MELGAFSISLAVKDIEVSRTFYERLGFSTIEGDVTQRWLVMKNGESVVGLFQGMFEKNILTFNPGQDGDGHTLDTFTDVRDLQRELKARGLTPTKEADESKTGPGSLTLLDPDGNPILIDQHV